MRPLVDRVEGLRVKKRFLSTVVIDADVCSDAIQLGRERSVATEGVYSTKHL